MKRHGFLIIGMACLFGFVLTLAAIATDLFDLWATYHFEEHDTVNKVSAYSGGGKLQVWRGMFISAEAQTIRFLQAGDREQDTIFTVGLGWEF